MQKKEVKIFVDGEVLVLDHFSGIGHYTASLLKAVDELLYEDEFAHFSIEVGVPWKMRHRIGKFSFENFSIRKMPVTPHLANGLKARGKLPPIDLLYGKRVYVFPNYSSWPTLFSPSVPIIYDLSFIFYPQFADEKNQQFLERQAQLSVNRSKKIITISKNSKKEIAEHYKYSPADISIVYPVLDVQKFYRRSQDEVRRVRAKYGIFDDYILFVGNIEPRKNLISLLRAYRNMDSELQKKYALLLVGAKGWRDGEINEEIIGMRKEGLRVIQPTDYVVDSDLPALFTGASAFAYVSVYEGFGIPPTESMACGTPVISADNSSLPEAVGDAAEKVSALDIQSITHGLEKVLRDKKLAEKYVQKGYSHIEKFNEREIAINFLKTLEEAAR